MIRTVSLLLVFLLLPASARDIFVAPSGDDSAAGSAEAPLRTIAHAASLAQPGDTVQIRAGLYREGGIQPVSGTEGAPITFTAYQQENVIISAADPVTGWTPFRDGIWQAKVDWEAGRDGTGNTLFYNGELTFPARQGAERDPLRLDNWGKIERYRLKSESVRLDDLKGWGDDFWNGAQIRLHRNDWTIDNATIADYDSDTGLVTFADPLGVISQKHELGYFISGTIKALDKPLEWFRDREQGVLYFMPPAGVDPNEADITFRRRDYAFDLRDRDHITVRGLTLRGCSIATNGATDHNIYEKCHLYAYDEHNYGRFFLAGSHNIFRDNEVSHAWGGAITVNGTDHQIVNNYFHDIGYSGTARVLNMDGAHHLVSYNTISKIARSFLDGFPYQSEFSYNLFEDGANLSWDTGFFDGDSGRGNGGGCIIHHNVFRDSQAIGIYCAIYAGNDLVVHHNIAYNIGPMMVRVGRYNFLKYYHNTFIGNPPTGNVDSAATALDSDYNNNLQTTTDQVASIGVNFRGNHNYVPADFVNYAENDFRLADGSAAVDAGIVLPGVNDTFTGKAPDAGALEHGEPMWRVGHDFDNPQRPQLNWHPHAGTNLFHDGQFSLRPDDWTKIGSPRHIDGNAWNTISTGLSRLGGRAIRMSVGDGVTRTFDGLKPNTTYTVAAEVRLTDQLIEAEKFAATNGKPQPIRQRGEDGITGLADGHWVRYEAIDFGPAGKYNQAELSYTRPPKSKTERFRGPAPETVQRAELRLDSPTGRLIGIFHYGQAVVDSYFATQLEFDGDISGTHDLVLVSRGDGAEEMLFGNIRLQNHTLTPSDRVTLGVTNHGGGSVVSHVGQGLWPEGFEEFQFTTGPAATTADIVVRNDGKYTAYLDRFALYETTIDTEDVSADMARTASAANLQLDLGEQRPLYRISLTGAAAGTGNVRISLWDKFPTTDSSPLWINDFLTTTPLQADETLVIRPRDLSANGVVELQDVNARYIHIQSLSGALDLGDVKVETFDETDLIFSDGSQSWSGDTWQVTFPQIVNPGELYIDAGADAAGKPVAINILDREDGAVIWQTSAVLSDAGRLLLRSHALASDARTRLASVQCRVVRLGGLANADSPRVILRGADAVVSPQNVALTGHATQSSQYYFTHGHAEDAINGVLMPLRDFTSTRNEPQAWWQVELTDGKPIDQIVVFNRSDAAQRIGDFRVSVWDRDPENGGKELWGHDYSYKAGDIPAGGSLTINGTDTSDSGTALGDISRPAVVRVQLKGREILSLAEVQVWAVR